MKDAQPWTPQPSESIFLFSLCLSLLPSLAVACFVRLSVMVSKCHWFLSTQSLNTPHHLWSISQLDIKGLLQWKMSVELRIIIFLSAERTAGWRLSIRSNSGVGGSLRWCFIFCSHTEFKTALTQKDRYRLGLFFYMAAAHQHLLWLWQKCTVDGPINYQGGFQVSCRMCKNVHRGTLAPVSRHFIYSRAPQNCPLSLCCHTPTHQGLHSSAWHHYTCTDSKPNTLSMLSPAPVIPMWI